MGARGIDCVARYGADWLEYGTWIPADPWEPLPPDDEDTDSQQSEEVSPIVISPPKKSEKEIEAEKSAKAIAWEKAAAAVGKKGRNVTLTPDEVMHFAYLMGKTPDSNDLYNLKQEYGDNLTEEMAGKWLEGIYHPEDTVDILSKFFELFDKEKSGKMSVNQVILLLTERGEGIPTKTARMAVADYCQKSGDNDPINYRNFVQFLINN